MARQIVSDELWEVVEPLIPKAERRFRYPGRKRLDDRKVLSGILFVLQTGIPWEHTFSRTSRRPRAHTAPGADGSAGSLSARSRGFTSTAGCAFAGNAATTSIRRSSSSDAA